MRKLPQKLTSIAPYVPHRHSCPVRLDANESFVPMPPAVEEAVRRALAEAVLRRYPDGQAEALRRAAAGYYGVGPECIVAGNGSDELIALILACCAAKGGKVAVCEPDFSMYRFYSRLYELEVITERREADIVIFSNPCNPTGAGITAAEVLNLAETADALVVVDEAYMEFWNESAAGYVASTENLIVLRTLSKAAGLAGLRVGFALAHEKLAALLRAAKSPYNLSAAAQAAGEAALRQSGYITEAARAIARSREELYNMLARFPGLTPLRTHTNFVLCELTGAERLHIRLMQKGVAVRLLGENLLRITAGSPADHERLCVALNEYFEGDV
ncbi:MAG: aminotransferase class I/II-fold pyridoxal phosphate-dependent enzyme [Oscillospiraceae bacterium]|jgi:histidinol-phosphate aminotransferase|nr:aminotransferase class I/II-fold pyridoxal phosphate-dependent enzyme [Oscillospiraceae bacterium]